MINKLLARIAGWYVFRSAPGKKAEFLNALNDAKVYFWGVRSEGDRAEAHVSVFGYSAAAKALSGVGVPESGYGLPFILYKYRKRWGIAAGAALGLVLMFISSLHAWEIVITGNSSVSESRILYMLRTFGVERGSYIPGINVSEVNSKMITALPELSSASLHIDGTSLRLDVIERVRPPEMTDRSGVYDVVAAHDGVVTGIEAYNGRALVKAGDTVTRGQVLITGVYTAGDDPYLEVATHARGKVTAYFYAEFVYTVPLKHDFLSPTGKTDVKTVYGVFGSEYRTFLGELFRFEHYGADVRTDGVYLGPLKLPITRAVITAEEYKAETVMLTPDAAREKALEAFEAWYSNDVEGRIEDIVFRTEYDDAAGCVTLRGSVKVTADIAEERENDVIGNNLLN